MKSTKIYKLKIENTIPTKTGDYLQIVSANLKLSTSLVYKSSLQILSVESENATNSRVSLQISEVNEMLWRFSFGITKLRWNELIF